MDYAALKALIEGREDCAEPLSRGDYPAVAAILNVKTTPARRFVPTDELINAAMQTAKYPIIKMIAAGEDIGTPYPIELRGACIILMDTFFQPKAFPEIDMDNPRVQTLIGGLVQGVLLTQEEADGINALADTTISAAEESLGRGTVLSYLDIAQAMKPAGVD